MMTRFVLLTAACAGLVCAQDNPLSAELKGRYTGIKNNLLKSAEKMSDENYAFKAADTIRPFGELIGHTSDANLRTCAALKGEQKAAVTTGKTAKADLVAAIKDSFAYCDTVFDSLKDADLTQMVSMGQRKVSKQAALWGVIVHDNEMYGTMCVYMRVKGVVPPSSDRGN
jgi:uncharacterized damage-inducible protein DinB